MSTTIKLRDYQVESVEATINWFRKYKSPSCLVLPTGAGKSLVIAELARRAKGRVLCLAHVKELVEQNHDKYSNLGLKAGIFSAGLERKDTDEKVIFGSVQSVARDKESKLGKFSLLIIDECHRVPDDDEGQYQQVIKRLQELNPNTCILGLTATPYRLGLGWIYQYHLPSKTVRTNESRFFKSCVFELSLKDMIKRKFLTPPILIDAPIACYDFSQLKPSEQGLFNTSDVNKCIEEQKRVTPGIIAHIEKEASDREGVMIFSASIRHAEEVYELLSTKKKALITGDTPRLERDKLIQDFKDRKIKFMVNVSVLTTGFDAPHVDLIALLRPTESVSLFQQIVGRGLRLSPGKKDCLVLDYTAKGHDIFTPIIDIPPVDSQSEEVKVPCPACGFINIFWGRRDEEGNVTEHFGRKCQGGHIDHDGTVESCPYRFRYKICDHCGAENDIAARVCHECDEAIIDDDARLKAAMNLKDAHVLRADTMTFSIGKDRKKKTRLEIRYYDWDGQDLMEAFYFDTKSQISAFYYRFARLHHKTPGYGPRPQSAEEAIEAQDQFRMPRFVIARKQQKYWQIREKIFDA